MVRDPLELKTARESLPEAEIVRVGGELDILSSPALRELLTEVTRLERPLVLDIAQLSFMDSTGLSVVMAALKRLRERGQDLVLCGPQQPVQRMLEICGLDRIIAICTTEAGALEHLRTAARG
jgi:anti-sigma B factor antagonist